MVRQETNASVEDTLIYRIRIWLILGTLLIATMSAPGFSQTQTPREFGTPALILQAAHNQDQSMAVRDRCRYHQKLTVHRFALLKTSDRSDDAAEVQNEKATGERMTEVTVEPSLIPDPQGRHEVLVRVTADTDDHGRPLATINPREQPGLLVETLWDELFFPLQEEKIPSLRFEPMPSPNGSVKFHFAPVKNAQLIILASGTVTLDPETAMIREIHIDSLKNLQTLNKELSKLTQISADIEYAPFRDLWAMPATAKGYGVSRLPHFGGFFRFEFEETGYQPIMKIPEPESAQ